MASLLAPEDQTLLEELVRVRHRQGDHSGALAGLHELRYLYRSDVDDDLRLIEARSLAAGGRSNEARPVYLAMIDANPSQLSLWREFGMFSWDIEDWRSVARCGSRLTKAGDVNPCGRLLMAVASRERGDLTEARLRLEGILEDHPGNVMASTLLTQVCLHHGDLGEAQKAWQVAVKSAPEGADVTRVTGILGNGP
jgi:predicted Zn-dependent protease